jgi:hypothetical protein
MEMRTFGESEVRAVAAPETCSGLDALLLQCLIGAASGDDALAPAGRPSGYLRAVDLAENGPGSLLVPMRSVRCLDTPRVGGRSGHIGFLSV